MTQERAASGDEGPSRKQGKLQRKRKREAATAAATAAAAVPPDNGASPVLADDAAAAGEGSASRLACIKAQKMLQHPARAGTLADVAAWLQLGHRPFLQATAGICRLVHIAQHQPLGITPLACNHTWRRAPESTRARA